MAGEDASGRARLAAEKLLRSELVPKGWGRRHESLASPIPVMSPAGSQAAWFVGVTVSGKLVGYLLLDRDGNFLKWSSFQHHPGSLAECPDAADWTSPQRVLETAKRTVDAGVRLETPFLSYDGVLDRLAWRVAAIDRHGSIKTLCVAGTFVFECAGPSTTS
jgi:hypothetical protein